jgi:hypothetical protein
MNNTQIKAEAMANVARMHIECGEVLERLSKLSRPTSPVNGR